MEWGIIMSVLMVAGTLLLIFAQPETRTTQILGRLHLHPSKQHGGVAKRNKVENAEYRRAA